MSLHGHCELDDHPVRWAQDQALDARGVDTADFRRECEFRWNNALWPAGDNSRRGRIRRGRGRPPSPRKAHEPVGLDDIACHFHGTALTNRTLDRTDAAADQRAPRSAAPKSLDGFVFSASASFATILTVGFRTPRSTPLT